jgi:hypothetical protein
MANFHDFKKYIKSEKILIKRIIHNSLFLLLYIDLIHILKIYFF